MTSNLNLEIANLALNINQTTKEEIGEMITEQCQENFAPKEHTHTMAQITDLEIPEVDTSNLATKEELAGKANIDHTHYSFDSIKIGEYTNIFDNSWRLKNDNGGGVIIRASVSSFTYGDHRLSLDIDGGELDFDNNSSKARCKITPESIWFGNSTSPYINPIMTITKTEISKIEESGNTDYVVWKSQLDALEARVAALEAK